MKTIELITYNVNGIRAAIKKGLVDWIKQNQFDVICFQETKAQKEQVDLGALEEIGYHPYWLSAEKKGYSGVLTLSKIKPDHVVYGCGLKHYDNEGRSVRLDFGDVTVLNTYFPSGTSGDLRQSFKIKFLDEYFDFIHDLKRERKKLIVCGDYNIAHNEIDIHNPKSNKDTSGFKPEERAWVTKFLESGFVDTFRQFNNEPHIYSWWSQRFNSRAQNKGWRIDYINVSKEMEKQILEAKIMMDVVHSDHCPVYLKLRI